MNNAPCSRYTCIVSLFLFFHLVHMPLFNTNNLQSDIMIEFKNHTQPQPLCYSSNNNPTELSSLESMLSEISIGKINKQMKYFSLFQW